MTAITVWLLVMSGPVYNGALGAVQPFMFPTSADCEQVARNAPVASNSKAPWWRCIQATVVRP